MKLFSGIYKNSFFLSGFFGLLAYTPVYIRFGYLEGQALAEKSPSTFWTRGTRGTRGTRVMVLN